MKKLIILFFVLFGVIYADIGEITAINGKAYIIRGAKKISILKHTKIDEKDIIKTEKNTKLQIIFKDHTVISLGQKTVFKIEEYLFSQTKPKARFNISKGLFKSITGKIGKIAPQNFKLKTQNATIGVRGTTIIGEVSKDIDTIICSSGKIVVTAFNNEVPVNKGEKTIVKRGFKPTTATKVSKKTILKFDTKIVPANIALSPKKTDMKEVKITPIKEIQNDVKPTEIKEIVEIKDKWGDWNKKDIISEDLKEQPKNKDNNDNKKQNEKKRELLEELQALRDKAGSVNPTYSGKISGFVDTPLNKISKDDNHIDLNFDLGKGTVDGSLGFKTTNDNWSAKIKDGKIDERGKFDFGLQNEKDRLNGFGDGLLSGKELQNADGSFRLKNETTNKEAFGTFHAEKK
jgi:hypothetical protein